MEQNTAASAFKKYVSVIPERGVGKTLDYGVPENLLSAIERGLTVKIPLGRSTCSGTIYQIKDQPDFFPVKGIIQVMNHGVPPDLMALAEWMSRYYCSDLSEVLKAVMPAAVRKNTQERTQLFVSRQKSCKQLLEACAALRLKAPGQAAVLDILIHVKKGILLSELLEEADVSRSSVEALVKKGLLSLHPVKIDRSLLEDEDYFKTKPKTLSEEQRNAYEAIVDSIRKNEFQSHLIQGVTGSGKTEVYLQAISETLKRQRGVIALVPEVALTPQTIERFRARFDDQIVVMHHRLSDGERMDAWKRVVRKEGRIVIGARSAVFAPVPDLGLIIVDEEHENSYKQSESQPTYHSRDVAVMRASLSKAVIILGSATPSLESRSNAEKGKYRHHFLTARAKNARPPKVTLIDMNREREKSGPHAYFSQSLVQALMDRYDKGEQSILFLNRRGFHTALFCPSCQEVVNCRNCATSLTFHRGEACMSCHLCGFTLNPPPAKCPKCQSAETMKFRGIGTEQVESVIRGKFPQVRTIRIDRDTTKYKGSHQKLLREFGSGKADILIGTQMIAKGLHFPNVTLVAILNADTGLSIPDFRASETGFQLITQVAGRSGRGELEGEVIIQTFMPTNPVIQHAIKDDFEAFYREEMASRELFSYPPQSQMVKIAFTSSKESRALLEAQEYRAELLKMLSKECVIHPIVPAGHFRVRGYYRYQFFVTAPVISRVALSIRTLNAVHGPKMRGKLLIDVNPVSTFF